MNTIMYEVKHGIGTDYFTVEKNSNFSFPVHMHRCYEIILILEGSMKVTIEKTEYLVEAGDVILIKPNQIHSLKTDTASRHILCIFSPELIAAISTKLIKYKLSSPLLKSVDVLYRDLFTRMNEHAKLPAIKGFLYLMGGLFYEKLDFTAEDRFFNDSMLLRRIFMYVESNYDKPCSLAELAKELNYDNSYLSRMFYANVGIPYHVFVRTVKVNHACYLLKNTQEKILEVALQCGFTSLSSFNRTFKTLTRLSPTGYREARSGNAFDK